MCSPRQLSFSFGINKLMDAQVRAFADENRITYVCAEMLVSDAMKTKAYKDYAINDAQSSEPSLLARHKFAVLLANKRLQDDKKEEKEAQSYRSLNNISPM